MTFSSVTSTDSQLASTPGPVAGVAAVASGPVAKTAVAEAVAGQAAADPRREQERALAAAILRGDEQAFAELHALYSTRLFRFAVKRLGDAAEAEDVVQDTFLEVHRCLASWEGRSSLLTWMFGIAHHQLCRRYRKKTPMPLEDEKLEAISKGRAEPGAERRIDAVRMLEACSFVLEEDVSDAQREIFERYYGGREPMKEIAADLGKSNQAIKISLFRTRRAMEARLAEQELRAIA